MTNLFSYLLRSVLSIIVVSVTYVFWGSEGRAMMLTGRNVVLVGIVLFSLLFAARLFLLRGRIANTTRNLIYGCMLILSSIYLSIVRFYFSANWGPLVCDFLPFLGVLAVLGQPLPLPGPSNSPPADYSNMMAGNPNLDSIFSEVETPPFEIPSPTVSVGDLLGEVEAAAREAAPDAAPEAAPTVVARNEGFEAALRTRVTLLERENSPFLPQDEKGEFWGSVLQNLSSAPDQREYHRRLEFESTDLLLREHKQCSLRVFTSILDQSPELKESSGGKDAEESFKWFLAEVTEARLGEFPTASEELRLIAEVTRNLRQGGPSSEYLKKFVDYP